MEDLRPTTDLYLPENKAKVIFYAFLRNGDFRAIQRKLTEQISVNVIGDMENTKVPASIAFDEQDFTAKLAIKEIVLNDGTKVLDMDDFLYNLSIADGRLIYDKVKQVSDNSMLSVEDKKKLQ